MFGQNVRERLLKLFEKKQLNSPEYMLGFIEGITDQALSKNLSFAILDSIANEDDDLLLELLMKEYYHRNMVLSVNLREYPDLLNRRIYIPIRYCLGDMAISIISSLRTIEFESVLLSLDGTSYKLNSESMINNITMLDLRNYQDVVLYYGNDSWTFDITIIGLTYSNEDEKDLPYIVEDAVGYGILGMSKEKLFNQFNDSIDLALDTKNPIMDDEEYEFYNANTDELNENSVEDFNKTRKEYFKDE